MDQWLLKSGANYQKLKIINFSPDYRGVVATKHIKVNSTLTSEKITHNIYPKIITNNSVNGKIKQILPNPHKQKYKALIPKAYIFINSAPLAKK
jgi:hypothetical protein